MVKGSTPEEMVTYFGEIVDGRSGIAGHEIGREVGAVFHELLQFPSVDRVTLSLPAVEDYAGAIHKKGPVAHRAYIEPYWNKGLIAERSRITSPYSSDRPTHPLVGVSFESLGALSEDSFVFVVNPSDSAILFSIVVAREALKRRGTYMLNLVKNL